MFALGALFAAGQSLPLDHKLAQEWFAAAADRGHAQAQLMYGRYLARGVAGEADPEGARVWLERARAQGVVEADDDLKALVAVAPA
jgi:TPR repeat protein